MPESATPVPEWSVEFGPDGSIKGWLSWPEDPIYRPVIGAFVRQQLIETAPTERRPKPANPSALSRMWRSGAAPPAQADAGEWVCFFNFTLQREQLAHAGDDLSLQCLETGQVLHPSPQVVKAGFSMRRTEMEVSDLIKLGSYSKRHTDVSGFLLFLLLDPGDQLELVYASLLRRRLDPGGLEAYLPILQREEQTILDVRDALLKSQEFRTRGYTINDRVGGWLVWSGLKEIHDAALPMSLSVPGDESRTAGKSYIGASNFGRYAARLALRSPDDSSLLGRWAKQHTSVVDGLRKHRDHVARSRHRELSSPIRMPKMLESMQLSTAGRRDGRLVHALRGSEGFVLTGPHVIVRAGNYRLTVNLTIDDPAVPLPESAVLGAIEISYDRATLAARPISADDVFDGAIVLDFCVPADVIFRSDRGQLECKISTLGTAGFVIGGVALETSEPEDGADLNAIEWLSLMRIGSAGERDNGESYRINGRSGSRGHVIYGPYTQLLPGEYELILTCQNGHSGAGTRSVITIEALASPASAIEKKQFALEPGENKFSLEFTVDDLVLDASRQGGAEFRVHKRKDSAFAITSVRTLRQPLGGG